MYLQDKLDMYLQDKLDMYLQDRLDMYLQDKLDMYLQDRLVMYLQDKLYMYLQIFLIFFHFKLIKCHLSDFQIALNCAVWMELRMEIFGTWQKNFTNQIIFRNCNIKMCTQKKSLDF